jgi:hypothetical protein
MTPISDMVEQMVADGIHGSIIVLAVRTAELVMQVSKLSADSPQMSADTLADVRRERDRARKAEQRKALKLQREMEATQANDRAALIPNLSADSPRTSADKRCDLSSLSSSVEGLIEEGSKEEKKKEAVTKCARGTRLSAGAQITPEGFRFALDAGMHRERVPAEWAEFVDYWIAIPGQRGTKTNWPATWRNRVRAITSKGGRNGQRPHAKQSGEAAVLAGLARAFGDRDGGSSGPADTEIPRGRFEFDAEPARRS